VSAGLLRHSSQKGYEGRVALLRRMERRVGFGEFPFDTPQLAAGRFILAKNI